MSAPLGFRPSHDFIYCEDVNEGTTLLNTKGEQSDFRRGTRNVENWTLIQSKPDRTQLRKTSPSKPYICGEFNPESAYSKILLQSMF